MKNKNYKIYKIGQKIGLNEKEIENVLTNTVPASELSSKTAGPGDDIYCGGLYASISTRDFK